MSSSSIFYPSPVTQLFPQRNTSHPSSTSQSPSMRPFLFLSLILIILSSLTTSALALRTHCMMYSLHSNCNTAECALAGGVCRLRSEKGNKAYCSQHHDHSEHLVRWSAYGPSACYGCGCVAVTENKSGLSWQVQRTRNSRLDQMKAATEGKRAGGRGTGSRGRGKGSSGG